MEVAQPANLDGAFDLDDLKSPKQENVKPAMLDEDDNNDFGFDDLKSPKQQEMDLDQQLGVQSNVLPDIKAPNHLNAPKQADDVNRVDSLNVALDAIENKLYK